MMQRSKNVFKLFFSFVVCFLLSVNGVQGQEPEKTIGEKGGMGYFMIGACILDLGDLNTRLVDNGYTEMSDNIFSMGGGGHAIINRIIIGGEGQALIGNKETSATYKTSLGGGYGFFNLGYIVYSNSSLRIYPLLGIGGGGISLGISEQGTAPTFDEVLEDPKRNADLFTGGLLLNLAVGAEYFLKTGADDKGNRGWIFGIRTGYTLTPVQGDWHMEMTEVSGGPDLGITGPYLRIMIGGGGFEKSK